MINLMIVNKVLLTFKKLKQLVSDNVWVLNNKILEEYKQKKLRQ